MTRIGFVVYCWLSILAVFLVAIETVEAVKPKKVRETVLDLNPNSSGSDDEHDGVTSGEDTTVSHIFIEENPDFVAEATEDTDDDDDDETSDWDDGDTDSADEPDDSDDDNDDNAKKRVSKKLKKTKKQPPLAFLKKNRGKITLVLTLFAFRSEIFQVLTKLTKHHAPKDAVTGVLKLLLFVNFMRRLQTNGKDTTAILRMIGQASPLLGAMLDKTMNYNPAYIPPINQHFTFESLNEYYLKDGMALQKAIRTRHEGLKWPSSSSPSMASGFVTKKETVTANANEVLANDGTVVVLDWTKLDTGITSLETLSHQIKFLLSEYRSLAMQLPANNNSTSPNESSSQDDYLGDKNSEPPASLEVVVLLESPGGSVAEYGLAGQHLLRLRNEPGITLTICVDKVAASGGYMLCCTASPGQLFAAPFAMLGSIGVIGTQVNVNKLLKNWGVEPIEFRGGKYKAPIGLLGPISKEGKKTTQTMIDQTHQAFKEHVSNARPILKDKIDEIGNGNVWLGTDAIDLNLVDAIKTSDEYIEEKIKKGSRVYKMVQPIRTGFLFGPRVGGFAESSKRSAMDGDLLEDDLHGLVQESETIMARLPARPIKSLLSKTFQFLK